jgi:thiol-disulfide isomerase/thioredoxin
VLIDRPWATATVTDVSTGEPFRIADLVASGKVVFLETMAIWCSNCLAQQVEATAAFEGLDPMRIEWVAIDVESSETPQALARYREQNGFPFTYAIADAELARALVAEFGEIVLSPPSVNIIVIGTDGRVTQLQGHKTADEIRELAAEHGAA